MNKLLQFFCIHKWVPEKIHDSKSHKSYYDKHGHYIEEYKCHCVKCGKIKKRKYKYNI